MDIKKEYESWLKNATADPDLEAELKSVSGNDAEISDRFYKDLEFGTAGLRGVIGAGTNRMNIYTVCRATQGLADFLNRHFESPSCAIGYDSRIKSDYFSIEAAKTLAANGVKVYIYKELEPTPCLSYAIRKFHTSGGIILTASHNPAKYNGYKCYDYNGYQMTDEEAAETYEYIQKVDYFTGIKSMDFDEAVSKGLIEYMDQDVIEDFLDEVQKQCVYPQICKKADLSVIYTPLNGTGNKPVRQILKRIGVENIYIVPEQEMPNGNFPTAPYPNPEIRQAFECALKLAETLKPDLLLATDPDCDRVGIAVNTGDDYKLLSGNDVGALLLDFVLSRRKANGTLPKKPIAVKTIVTTELCRKIAADYGCELRDVLTGFKFIGEQITQLEEKGEENRFVFGFEESYGYLGGTYVRDKDAVIASMLICEMVAFYKAKGLLLTDVLEELYKKYGYYFCSQKSFTCEGESGMKRIAGIMDTLRSETPAEIAGERVVRADDYEKSVSRNLENGTESKITLPVSNVLCYYMADGSSLIVRPSGTEPKIKLYIGSVGVTEEDAIAKRTALEESGTKLLGF